MLLFPTHLDFWCLIYMLFHSGIFCDYLLTSRSEKEAAFLQSKLKNLKRIVIINTFVHLRVLIKFGGEIMTTYVHSSQKKKKFDAIKEFSSNLLQGTSNCCSNSCYFSTSWSSSEYWTSLNLSFVNRGRNFFIPMHTPKTTAAKITIPNTNTLTIIAQTGIFTPKDK